MCAKCKTGTSQPLPKKSYNPTTLPLFHIGAYISTLFLSRIYICVQHSSECGTHFILCVCIKFESVRRRPICIKHGGSGRAPEEKKRKPLWEISLDDKNNIAVRKEKESEPLHFIRLFRQIFMLGHHPNRCLRKRKPIFAVHPSAPFICKCTTGAN